MKKLRKLFSLLLCTALCLSLAPGAGAEGWSALPIDTATLSQISARLNEIRSQIDGRYWNNNRRSHAQCKSDIESGNYYQSTTGNACQCTREAHDGPHYNPASACKSNTFNDAGGWAEQCHGFANYMLYALFGVIRNLDGVNYFQLYGNSANTVTQLKPGDVVNQASGAHWYMVWYVNGDDLYVVDCNNEYNCKIQFHKYYWSASKVLSRIKSGTDRLNRPKCNTVDDPTPDSPDLTVTANDATGVTSNDATLTGFIHFGNYQPTHWGVDCGTSSSNLPCVIINDSSKQVINSSTGVSISFNFKNDSTSDPNSPSTPYYPLKANTTYYYRFWVKYGNDQYVHSEIKQFTTGNATIPSFSNISVSNITSTTARLNYTINYGADNVPKYYGLYLGTSEGEMTKAVLNMQQYNESTYVNSTHQPIAGTNLEKRWPSGPINGNSIAFGSEGPTLSPATTYYYKLWITDNSGDHEYCSAVQSFTTSGSAVAVTGISLDIASLTMTGGTSQKLTATVSPSNATNKNVTWSSSNPSVATVSTDGVVNAVQGGTATITATTSDGGKTASCTVTVKDVHTFRFDANGGSGSMSSVSACSGEAVVFPPCAFTRPGYTFLGWYGYRANDRTFFAADVGWRTEEAIAQAGLIKQIYHDRLYTVIDNSWIDGVNGPCTFIMYAAWKANDYTVTYDANGGTGAPAAQTKTKGTNLILSSAQPTHASSSAGSYTVTLNANGGSVSPTSLNAARTTSYTFKNWNTAADGSGTSYALGTAYSTDANVTLYAQWESKTTTAAVALPTPTRDGYVFKGWATSSSAEAGVIGSYTPTENLTLYAAWEDLSQITSGKWGNLFWALDTSGALTISGTGAMADFDEDSSDAWLARRDSIVSAVIESGVTSIGDGAFSFCTELSSVTIPDGVTSIGEYAFNYCYSLENITIPDSMTSIGERAFQFCNYLTSVTIPDSVTSIGDGAFSFCGELTSVEISNSVTSIGDDAFCYCGRLESVTIPDGVTSIGNDAFNTCGMMSITIPDSVTSIGNNAFTCCFRLQYVFYGGTREQWDAISIGSDNDSLSNTTVFYKAYVLNFDLPDSLTTIEDEAFSGGALSYVKLPEGVTSIGSRAFADCPNLAYIYIPEETGTIARDAFSGVSGLTILGRSGSYAEFYAQRNGIAFVAVE